MLTKRRKRTKMPARRVHLRPPRPPPQRQPRSRSRETWKAQRRPNSLQQLFRPLPLLCLQTKVRGRDGSASRSWIASPPLKSNHCRRKAIRWSAIMLSWRLHSDWLMHGRHVHTLRMDLVFSWMRLCPRLILFRFYFTCWNAGCFSRKRSFACLTDFVLIWKLLYSHHTLIHTWSILETCFSILPMHILIIISVCVTLLSKKCRLSQLYHTWSSCIIVNYLIFRLQRRLSVL